jgi:hypothetical protein
VLEYELTQISFASVAIYAVNREPPIVERYALLIPVDIFIDNPGI